MRHPYPQVLEGFASCAVPFMERSNCQRKKMLRRPHFAVLRKIEYSQQRQDLLPILAPRDARQVGALECIARGAAPD